jgi:predicted ATPase
VKLVNAHVTYYRSIEDSQKFAVEPDVTCLVGKNESGKTTVLQALYLLNPVESTKHLHETIDFPAKLGSRLRRDFGSQEPIKAVTATFRYNTSEMKTIEEDLGAGALGSPEFTVAISYRDAGKTFRHAVDEAAVVAHLRSKLDISLGSHKPVANAATLEEFRDALTAIDEPSGAVTKAIATIANWRDEDVELYMIDTYAMPLMPKFVYFDDYDTMPGKISVPDVQARIAAGTATTRGELALASLLDMAGVGLEDFLKTDSHERLIRQTENAGNSISEEVFEYWSQNNELEVSLEVLSAEEGATPPMNVGPILQIRVRNQRHKVSVPLDERSRGFIWFFSFLAYFNKIEENEGSNLILLLDEPGLSLHARAQEDLLRLIDERLVPKHQVLYTTHSPFMVAPKQLHRVRTVIDQDKIGTKVSADIFRADSDTAFPLLAAMGIELTQTLFVGENTLLLEGPSDLIYLDVLSDLVETNGGTGLDPLWVKTPIGGAGKLSTFVTLLGANSLNVAVVVDASSTDTQAVGRLRDNGQLANNGLVEISEFTGTADADIEDLFDPAFYIELVNLALADKLPKPLKLTDLRSKNPRIVVRVGDYLASLGIGRGRFDHYKPAAVLLRKQGSLVTKIDQATIARAAKLFERLNALIA